VPPVWRNLALLAIRTIVLEFVVMSTLAGLSKAELTRATILDAAVAMAAEGGLESLTIGSVAGRAGLSKSGVFSRLGSREELQIAVLGEYERRFVDDVLLPALREKPGLPRLSAMFRRWVGRVQREELATGCLFMSSAFEYDDQPGPIRTAVVAGVDGWRAQLARAARQAVDCGHLPPGTDVEQLVFEIYSLMLGLHHDARFCKDPHASGRVVVAFERLIAGRQAA
jgi:AcrR family transcriptional regulator